MSTRNASRICRPLLNTVSHIQQAKGSFSPLRGSSFTTADASGNSFVASVILERLPVVLPELPAWEEEFMRFRCIYVFDPAGGCPCIEVHQHRSKVGIVRTTLTIKAIQVCVCSLTLKWQPLAVSSDNNNIGRSIQQRWSKCLRPQAGMIAFNLLQHSAALTAF